MGCGASTRRSSVSSSSASALPEAWLEVDAATVRQEIQLASQSRGAQNSEDSTRLCHLLQQIVYIEEKEKRTHGGGRRLVWLYADLGSIKEDKDGKAGVLLHLTKDGHHFLASALSPVSLGWPATGWRAKALELLDPSLGKALLSTGLPCALLVACNTGSVHENADSAHRLTVALPDPRTALGSMETEQQRENAIGGRRKSLTLPLPHHCSGTSRCSGCQGIQVLGVLSLSTEEASDPQTLRVVEVGALIEKGKGRGPLPGPSSDALKEAEGHRSPSFKDLEGGSPVAALADSGPFGSALKILLRDPQSFPDADLRQKLIALVLFHTARHESESPTGTPARAHTALQGALARDRFFAVAALKLAEIEMEKENAMQAAMLLLQHGIEEDGRERAFGVHLVLGRALSELGRMENALFHLRKAVESDPDSVEALTALGELLMKRVEEGEGMEEVAQARACLERAKYIDPSSFSVLCSLASLLHRLYPSEWKDAEKLFERAMRAESRENGLKATEGMGLLLADFKGDDPQAMATASHLYRMGKGGAADTTVELARTVGKLQLQRGDATRAAKNLRVAVNSDPENGKLQFLFAQALEKSGGDLEETAACYRKAVSLCKPEDEQSVLVEAATFLQAKIGGEKEVEEATRLLERAAALAAATGTLSSQSSPKLPERREGTATFGKTGKGQIETEKGGTSRRRRSSTAAAELFFTAGTLACGNVSLDKAAASFRGALALEPTHAGAMEGLEDVLLEKGDFQSVSEALAVLRQAEAAQKGGEGSSAGLSNFLPLKLRIASAFLVLQEYKTVEELCKEALVEMQNLPSGTNPQEDQREDVWRFHLLLAESLWGMGLESDAKREAEESVKSAPTEEQRPRALAAVLACGIEGKKERQPPPHVLQSLDFFLKAKEFRVTDQLSAVAALWHFRFRLGREGGVPTEAVESAQMCVQSVDPLKHPVLFGELHALLGCLHFDPDRIDDRSQDVDQAEFHLENAVSGDDHLVRGSELFRRCHFRLGLIKKFHRKDRETARERFASALVGAPPAPTQDVQTACAHFHIGGLLEDEGRKPSDILASEHLRLSLETGFPSPLVAHAELARVKHRKLGRAAEAVEHYRAALPLRRFDLVFGLGEALEASEGPRKCEDEVARLYAEALAWPHDTGDQSSSSRSGVGMRDQGGEVSVARLHLRIGMMLHALAHREGVVFCAKCVNDHYKEALQTAEGRRLLPDMESAKALHGQGILLHDFLGHPEEAKAIFTELRKIRPDDPDVNLRLVMLTSDGCTDPEEALRAFSGKKEALTKASPGVRSRALLRLGALQWSVTNSLEANEIFCTEWTSMSEGKGNKDGQREGMEERFARLPQSEKDLMDCHLALFCLFGESAEGRALKKDMQKAFCRFKESRSVSDASDSNQSKQVGALGLALYALLSALVAEVEEAVDALKAALSVATPCKCALWFHLACLLQTKASLSESDQKESKEAFRNAYVELEGSDDSPLSTALYQHFTWGQGQLPFQVAELPLLTDRTPYKALVPLYLAKVLLHSETAEGDSDHEEAERLARESLRPGVLPIQLMGEAHEVLGRVADAQGRKEEARVNVEKAVGLLGAAASPDLFAKLEVLREEGAGEDGGQTVQRDEQESKKSLSSSSLQESEEGEREYVKRKRRLERALQAAESAEEPHVVRANLHLSLGLLLSEEAEERDLEGALRHLESAVELSCDNMSTAQLHLGRVVVLLASGEREDSNISASLCSFDRARKHFKAAIALAADGEQVGAEASYGLGVLLWESFPEEREEAREALETAVREQCKETAYAHFLLAQMSRGDFPQNAAAALKHLEAAAVERRQKEGEKPSDVQLSSEFILLAEIHRREGRNESAAAVLDSGLAVCAGSNEASMALLAAIARQKMHEGSYADALSAATRLLSFPASLAVSPEQRDASAEAHHWRGLCLLETGGDKEAARFHLEQAADKDRNFPGRPASLFFLARLLSSSNEAQETALAKEHLQTALSILEDDTTSQKIHPALPPSLRAEILSLDETNQMQGTHRSSARTLTQEQSVLPETWKNSNRVATSLPRRAADFCGLSRPSLPLMKMGRVPDVQQSILPAEWRHRSSRWDAPQRSLEGNLQGLFSNMNDPQGDERVILNRWMPQPRRWNLGPMDSRPPQILGNIQYDRSNRFDNDQSNGLFPTDPEPNSLQTQRLASYGTGRPSVHPRVSRGAVWRKLRLRQDV